MQWLVPLNSTSLPWCTTRSMRRREAALVVAEDRTHFPNSMLVVMTGFSSRSSPTPPGRAASPRRRRSGRGRTRPGSRGRRWWRPQRAVRLAVRAGALSSCITRRAVSGTAPGDPSRAARAHRRREVGLAPPGLPWNTKPSAVSRKESDSRSAGPAVGEGHLRVVRSPRTT